MSPIPKNKKSTKPKARKSGNPPIVAIGGSAGGLEAITEFLKNLSPNTGFAYVYIQHLDPNHESLLSVILARVTKMKVVEAMHLSVIERDHLYIIPPDKDMTIMDGVLTLNKRSPKPVIHMPIDYFFVSLAEKHKDASIGIVLSGNAHDGTLGLKPIKSAGGLTFAQDDSAKFQSMPRSAISEGVVDKVLSPKEMAIEIEHVSKNGKLIKNFKLADSGDDDTGDLSEDEDTQTIINIVKKAIGVDFAHYKLNTIKRRIVRRMLLFKLEKLNDYARYLQQHNNEVRNLYNDLLINVTNFFRDPDAMEFLKKTLFPKIIKSKTGSEPIRIWVPACSTGEEAYSIAMVLMEMIGDKEPGVPIQIFATDLSEVAIAKARLGLYSRHEMMDVSPKRQQRFFSKVDGSYRINKSIRDLCVFAPHNIFKDPPFSRVDFISCCNLMIYLDTALQKKVIATFHYSLNNPGYLMLGKSETIGSTSGQLFSQVDKKFKVYARKKEAGKHAIIEIAYRIPDKGRDPAPITRKVRTKDSVQGVIMEKVVDDILLAKFMPASVVINQDLEILQFRGSTSLFLEPSPGKASLNLLKMARPGLGFELRNAIHKATKSGEAIGMSSVEIKSGAKTVQVTIEVIPLYSEGEEKLFIVIFEEMKLSPQVNVGVSLSKDKLVKRMQNEMNSLREDMRSILEEHEISNGELQSANEEIVSTNEELQSINEELETSKEEVESTNEELMTINTELRIRNDQLAEAYEYSEAIFSTIRESLVILDKDLRVKKANQSFYRTFNLHADNTEGILIYELHNRLFDLPQMHELLENFMIETPQIKEFEVKHDFPGIGLKVLAINARRVNQKIHMQENILLAIEDITEHKKP